MTDISQGHISKSKKISPRECINKRNTDNKKVKSGNTTMFNSKITRTNHSSSKIQ